MDRLLQTLVFLLVVVGIGNAFVVWDADRHARDDAERQACLQQVEALAAVALLAGGERIDEDDVTALGAKADAC